MADELHSRGARLILTARSIDKLAQICQELKDSARPNCHDPTFRYLDLADTNGLEGTLKDLAAVHGRVDVLINNAGMTVRACCAETELRVHRNLMEVNYFGPLQTTRAALPYLTESRGMVVVIGSVQSRISIPYRSAYAASKHALLAYFDCLRAELASENVHVLMVIPGYIRTNLSLHAVTGSGRPYGRMDKRTEDGLRPDLVARSVLAAIESRKQEIVLAPLVPRLAMAIRTLLPSFFFWLMRKRAAKEKLKNE